MWSKFDNVTPVLEISENSQENTCARKRGSGTGVSGEFSKISNNTFFTEHLWVTAPVLNLIRYVQTELTDEAQPQLISLYGQKQLFADVFQSRCS